MHHENTSQIFNDLVKFLTIFFKYKWMILAVFIAVSAIGIYLVMDRYPTLYEAKASIIVKLGQESMYRSETQANRTERVMGQQEALNNEISILTNHGLIKNVVASVGVKNLYPDFLKDGATESDRILNVAVMKFTQNLSALPIKESNIIEVSFKNERPAIAAKALNTLVEKFKDKHADVYSDPKSSFLEEQTGNFSEKLKQIEDKLQSFKQTHQVYSLDEQRSALLNQRVVLDTTFRTTQTQIQEVEQKIAFTKSPGWNSEAILASKTQLRTLQQKERELLERYTPNSRMVQSIRKEMQAVEESIVGPLEDARKIELSKLEGELGALKVKADGLRRQIGQISGEVRAIDSREKEYLNLKRELGTHEGNYKVYLGKFEESRIVDDMNKRKLSNVSVIQNAIVPVGPAPDKKKQLIPLSIIFALVVGFGLAYLRELVPQRLTTPLAAEKHLSLPVMVTIALKK
jgi:uncharacterized protein involved in exopolysaccharide biosynthesis